MSRIRTVTDFPRNEQGLVDHFLGTAYDVVKNVSDNIVEIKEISAMINLPEEELLIEVAKINNKVRENLKKLDPILFDISKGLYENNKRKIEISFENITFGKESKFIIRDRFKKLTIEEELPKSISEFSVDLQRKLDNIYNNDIYVLLKTDDITKDEYIVIVEKEGATTTLSSVDISTNNNTYFFNWYKSTSSLSFIVHNIEELYKLLERIDKGFKEFEGMRNYIENLDLEYLYNLLEEIDEFGNVKLEEILKEAEKAKEETLLEIENIKSNGVETLVNISSGFISYINEEKEEFNSTIEKNISESTIIKEEVENIYKSILVSGSINYFLTPNDGIQNTSNEDFFGVLNDEQLSIYQNVEGNPVKLISNVFSDKKWEAILDSLGDSVNLPNSKYLNVNQGLKELLEDTHYLREAKNNIGVTKLEKRALFDNAENFIENNDGNNVVSFVDDNFNPFLQFDSTSGMSIKGFNLDTKEDNEVLNLTDLIGNKLLSIDSKGLITLNKDQKDFVLHKETDNTLKVIFNNKSIFVADNVKAFSKGENSILFTKNDFLGIETLYKVEISTDGYGGISLGIPYTPNTTDTLYDHIIITGQSLALGNSNKAVHTESLHKGVFTYNGGTVGNDTKNLTYPIVPLKEFHSETIGFGFSQRMGLDSKDYLSKRLLLVSGQAKGGAIYERIKKNGSSPIFSNCIKQVEMAKTWGGSVVKAIFLIHGEGDGNIGNKNYAENIIELREDYSNEINKINNQQSEVVLFTCQTSSASGYTDIINREKFVTPLEQFKASLIDKKIILVCPKYQFTYNDHAHIDKESAPILGEYYAMAYKRVMIEGKEWKPLHPTNISISDKKFIIDFHVPVGKLVLDTVNISLNSSNENYGFNVNNRLKIEGVKIVGDSTLEVLVDKSIDKDDYISYAFHNGEYRKSGKDSGSRGNLRDENNIKSSFDKAFTMYNWCVAFKYEVK